jgi:molecular chaperone IbpA
MTKTLALRSGDVSTYQPFHRFGIGFESLFDELTRVNERQANASYPFYNIISQDEDNFSIELAVAGFREGEIEIQVDKNQLSITGNQVEPAEQPKYVVHGISSHSFNRTFSIAEHVVVKNAYMANGILTINLERKVPESAKPKMIKIDYKK